MALILRTLSADDEQQALAAHRALADEDFMFLLGYTPGGSFAGFVHGLERQRAGQDLKDGWVASTFLVAEVAGVIVGRLSLRHTLNDHLMRIGGHIGFGVLPEHRGRGYASSMLSNALARAARLGISRALVTCDEPNLASRRVIEKCGGAYEDSYLGAESSFPVRRYWIETERGG